MDEDKQVNEDTETSHEGGEAQEAETTPKEEKDYKKMWEDQKRRAELAEERLKGLKKESESKQEILTPKNESSTLTSTEIYALIKADVPEEDIPLVQKYAKTFGKTISEALGDKMLKEALQIEAEKRTTAQATNTETRRSGGKQKSNSQVQADFESGKMPTTREGWQKLYNAKYNIKD